MIVIITILTQLVNYTLVTHNTVKHENPIELKDQNSPQRPLLHIETVSLSN